MMRADEARRLSELYSEENKKALERLESSIRMATVEGQRTIAVNALDVPAGAIEVLREAGYRVADGGKAVVISW